MIGLLFFLVIIAAFATGFAWIVDRPGIVTIDWLGHIVEVNIATAIIALIILIVIAMIIWRIALTILRSPQIMSGYFQARKRDKGYRALSKGMIAVGAGDARQANEFATKSAKMLKNEPLTLLLQAQAAQLNDKREEVHAAFETMLNNPETRLLGLHGLYMQARHNQESEAARFYAEKAMEGAPNIPWASHATFEFQCIDHDWQSALRTLQRIADYKLIDRTTFRRKRAVLLTAQAMELEVSDPDRAKDLSLEAHRLAPDLVPAAVIAARLLSRAGGIRKATKILEATWKRSPHPDLADVYIHVRPGDTAQDRFQRARTLSTRRGHQIEGQLALAHAAIDAQNWQQAHNALTAAMRSTPTARTCLLMADLVEAESGDIGRVREWLSRAVKAERDPVWTADGIISREWAPISPATGRLDAFEWRVPVETLDVPVDVLTGSTPSSASLPDPIKTLGAAVSETVNIVSTEEPLDEKKEKEKKSVEQDNMHSVPANQDKVTDKADTSEKPKVMAKPNDKQKDENNIGDEIQQPIQDISNDDEPIQNEKQDNSKEQLEEDHSSSPDGAISSAQDHSDKTTDKNDADSTKAQEQNTPLKADNSTIQSFEYGRAPDDPGIDPEAEVDSAKKRRFRLF